jgi:hypothetical protein
MADYSNTSMADLVAQLGGVKPDVWLRAGETWTTTATNLQSTQDNLQQAWDSTHHFGESQVFVSFQNEVAGSQTSVAEWRPFVEQVGAQLTSIGGTIIDTQRIVGGLVQPYADAERRCITAMDANEGKAAQRAMEDIRGQAANVMGVLSSLMQQALERIAPVPHAKYGGPMAPKQAADQDPRAGDPNATPGGGATPGDTGGVPGATPATTPATDPAAPKTPEAKDPVEEAGKLIDVVGKGIDLVGKVPENLDKWVTLAQNAKDLLGADPSSAATTPDPGSAASNGLTPDEPALAGSTSTAPIYKPEPHTPPTTSGGGLGGGGLGSIGMPFSGGSGGGRTDLPTGTTDRPASSLRSATTAGGAGAEPALTGKTATTASTGTQSSTPPMYPPMSGAGAAGATGRGEIRPGAAASKPGFTVPSESSASERMRRQGVQSDLQGRTNGEHGTPSGAPPLRKRRPSTRSRRTTTEDVLDDELWKL